MGKKVIVGLDFDGVVAYNPARIIRAPVTFVKRRFLGVKRLKFFVPKHKWQRLAWVLLHESSIFPARGVNLLKRLVEEKKVEVHLVTGRYSFLNQNLTKWLERHLLIKVFKSINVNVNDEQPHLFKEKTIKRLKFDFFVEDNLDIVQYLDGKKGAQVAWIYNIIDKRLYDREGFANLEKALVWILEQKGVRV